MRIAHWRPVLLAAVALGLVISGCTPPPPRNEDLRTEYQASLDSSASRFDASSQVIGQGGRLYLRKGAPVTLDCIKFCGTVEPKDPKDPLSGYKVSLPTGYRVPANNPAVLADKLITELTYWDPIAHKKISTRFTYNQSVFIPRGQTATTIDQPWGAREVYIQGAFVHPKKLGGWVVESNIAVWYEPIGLKDGNTAVVRVSGDSSYGLTVCAPPDAALSTTYKEDGIPVTSFSRSC